MSDSSSDDNCDRYISCACSRDEGDGIRGWCEECRQCWCGNEFCGSSQLVDTDKGLYCTKCLEDICLIFPDDESETASENNESDSDNNHNTVELTSDEDFLRIALKYLLQMGYFGKMEELLKLYSDGSFLLDDHLVVALRRFIATGDFKGMFVILDVDEYYPNENDRLVRTLHRFIITGDFDGLKMYSSTFTQDKITALINDTSCYDTHYGSALHDAVCHNHPDDCGCHHLEDDMDVVKCGKKTIIPYRKEIVEFLLENGADVKLENYYKETPYDKIINEEGFFSDPVLEVTDLVFFDENITPRIKNTN